MSITPGILDFNWVRGTTTPLIVGMVIDSVPVPYDDVRLSVYNGSTLAFRLTLEDHEGTGPGTVEITAPGVFKFTPTAAQTRSLKQSKTDGSPGKSSYEVEIRNGELEDVYLMGVISGIGGLNDDEEDAS
jgi:hypothetical protein